MRPLLLLCALLAVAPSASAGTAASPDVEDDAGDAGAGNEMADLTAAWFESGADALRVTLQIAKLEGPTPGVSWLLLFSVGDERYYAGASDDVNEQGRAIRFWVGGWDDIGPVDYAPIEGEATPGSPATFAFALSRSDLGSLFGKPADDATLTAIQAWTGVVTAGNLGVVRFPPTGPGTQTFDTADAPDLTLASAAANATDLPRAEAAAPNAASPSRPTPPAPVLLVAAAGALIALARREP